MSYDMMETSPHHLFGRGSDKETESPSLIAARDTEKRVIARIQTHFISGAPFPSTYLQDSMAQFKP